MLCQGRKDAERVKGTVGGEGYGRGWGAWAYHKLQWSQPFQGNTTYFDGARFP